MEPTRSGIIALAIVCPLIAIVGLFVGRSLPSDDPGLADPETGAARAVAPQVANSPVASEMAPGVVGTTDAATPAPSTVLAVPPTPSAQAKGEDGDDFNATIANTFVAAFSQAHADEDLGFLLGTLHPEVYDTFDAQTCADYVQQTMGSIQDMVVVDVGEATSYELPGVPQESRLVFEDAIPVAAEWAIAQSGDTQSLTFHLAGVDGAFYWLTTCGY